MAVINISDCIYYISGPTNIGIIEERLSDTKSNLYMIDSGCNTEDGKRIFTEITEYFSQKDITIKAIINNICFPPYIYFMLKYYCAVL